jgi:hypothetical protein
VTLCGACDAYPKGANGAVHFSHDNIQVVAQSLRLALAHPPDLAGLKN